MLRHSLRIRPGLLLAVVLVVGVIGGSLTDQLTSGAAEHYSVVRPVGRPVVFTSSRAREVIVRSPSGVKPGDLLIAYVDTLGTSRVRCPAGFRRLFDSSNRRSTRLAACVSSAAGPNTASISVVPPAPVSALTLAFAGASPHVSIVASMTRRGRLSPGLRRGLREVTAVYADGAALRSTTATGQRAGHGAPGSPPEGPCSLAGRLPSSI